MSFYEEVDQGTLNAEQKEQLGLTCSSDDEKSSDIEKTVHATKSICLLSKWPFFETFRHFLAHLYRVSRCGPHEVPIER